MWSNRNRLWMAGIEKKSYTCFFKCLEKMGYDAWILLLNDQNEELYYEYKRSGFQWFVQNKEDTYEYDGKQIMGEEQYHWSLTELEALTPDMISFECLKAMENSQPAELIRTAQMLLKEVNSTKVRNKIKALPDYGTGKNLRVLIRELEDLSEPEPEPEPDLTRIVALARERKTTHIVLGMSF